MEELTGHVADVWQLWMLFPPVQYDPAGHGVHVSPFAP